jgi:hypothetical protein
MDYSPQTAYRKNRALCFRLLDQIDELLNWDGEPTTRDLGDIVEARNHLEYAVRYLGTLGESISGSTRPSRTARGSVVPDASARLERTDNAKKARRRERRQQRKTARRLSGKT